MMTFGNNLKHLRKENKLTQESLASLMNVSIGAVYKWEQDMATPDYNTLMNLADFFMVSVDALIGYEPKREGLADGINEMNKLADAGDYDAAFSIASRLEIRYPNSFKALYEVGILYEQYVFDNINVSLSKKEISENINKAISLLNKALIFINDSENPNMSRYDIESALADCYLAIDDRYRSIEILKRINYDGINNSTIASLYIDLKEENQQDIKSYLSDALINCCNSTLEAILAYLSYYERYNDSYGIKNALSYIIYFIKGLEGSDGTCYLNKFLPYFYFRRGLINYLAKDKYMDDLKEARRAIENYDSINSNTNRNIRFAFNDIKIKKISDDAGPTSKYIIDKYIADYKVDKDFCLIWEGVFNEG